MNISAIHDKNLATFCHIGGLCKENQNIIQEISPKLEPLLAQITDAFYRLLAEDEQTAPYLEGRIEALKATHLRWLRDILSGHYDDDFIKRQEMIGEAHVRAKVPPHFVAASMSHLRASLPPVIHRVEPDATKSAEAIKTLMQVLDLCQYLIDRKYAETLMSNLGISPALLNRLQTLR